MGDAQNLSGFVHPALDLIFGHFAQFEPKGHVLVHRHVGIKGVGLEDHGDIAILRRYIVDHLIVNQDAPFGDLFQSGQAAQCRGFATARGAHQYQEFLVLDVQIQIVQRYNIAKPLGNMVISDTGHKPSSLWLSGGINSLYYTQLSPGWAKR